MGEAFCSGADMSSLQTMQNKSLIDALRYAAEMNAYALQTFNRKKVSTQF